MTRFLFATDIHGDRRAYDGLPALCRQHGVSMIVHGGDMLPKGRDIFATQADFLSEYFPSFLDRCAAAGLSFFGLFGNDDLMAYHSRWLDLARSRHGVFDLAIQWHELPGGYWVRGNSFVPDYPFGLKDWCLRDSKDAEPVPTRSLAVTTTLDGAKVIDDPKAFFAKRPTLEEHLDSLVDPAVPMDRAILVCHPPPAGLGLGTLWSGEDVGSKSVHSWVTRHQPMLTLSGHIHESPDVQRALRGYPWHTVRCGRTTCHQPGQALPSAFTYSIIELTADSSNPVRIECMEQSL